MNDDFLHQLRVDPPASFLAELKAKLDGQAIAPRAIRRVSLRTLAILVFLGGTGVAMALMVSSGLLPWGHQLREIASTASLQPKSDGTAPAGPQSSRSESTKNNSISTIDGGPLPGEIGNAPITKSAAVSPAKPRDDWELANRLLRAAKAGDRDAQYRLSTVIDWCNTILDYYFTKDGTPLTLDEGLEKAPNASQKRQAGEEFPHCHRFQEHNVALELGSAEYWLERATQGGQPLAQAVTARKMLEQDARNNAVPLVSNLKGMSITIPSGAPPDRRAVDLLHAAVKSLDPKVLEIIGDEQTELHGSRMGETVDRVAWIYVACQRGLDCSATSQWAVNCEPKCDVSTPEGIMKYWSFGEWPAVQQRAKDISAKLDAGKWDELGLGP